MKSVVVFLVGLLTVLNFGYSQSDCQLSPSMEAEFSETISNTEDFCFDVAWVQDECIPIYINVNVHFFLDDNCEGELATAPCVSGNLNKKNAFFLAEDLIKNANEFYEISSENGEEQWNSQYHNAPVTEKQCIPIRYVLKGAYVHCDTDAQSTGIDFGNYNQYEIDGNTTMNIYVAHIPAKPDFNASGFASNGTNDAVVENFSPGLLNHELGHGFNLIHTFKSDQCSDTWQFQFEWDNNCDGIIDDEGDKCWANEASFNNGVDVCDPTIPDFCELHPCCDWKNQDNNLMNYTGWGNTSIYSALTPCQLSRMLVDISDQMCDYVLDINSSCPPPNAFIGTLPNLNNEIDCPTCFYMNASFNETVYEMEIVDGLGNIVIETGEVFDEVGRYCIYPRVDKYGDPYWPNGFEVDESYAIRLNVYNQCGDMSEDELTFILPDPCNTRILPQIDKRFEFLNLSPNPAAQHVSVDYNIYEEGVLKIYGGHLASSISYGLISESEEIIRSDNSLQIDISNWNSGMNSLIFKFNEEIHVENFIKQ